MIAFIVVASVLAYLACGLVAARWWYGRIRPFREPINCRHWSGCGRGKHDSMCYRRNDRTRNRAGNG